MFVFFASSDSVCIPVISYSCQQGWQPVAITFTMSIQEDDDITSGQLCTPGASTNQSLSLLISVQFYFSFELLQVVLQFLL